MASALQLAQQLQQQFLDSICPPTEFRGDVAISVREAQRIHDILQHAKKGLGFDMLLDIASVDHLGDDPRFEVVYHLYSFDSAQYLRVNTRVSEKHPSLPTVSSLWKGADWYEREIFDMMGIQFIGHPDLRRILMWEGYPHHPLRKEFPLSGLPVDDLVKPAPMAGGPFVTSTGCKTTVDREPRGKGETDSIV